MALRHQSAVISLVTVVDQWPRTEADFVRKVILLLQHDLSNYNTFWQSQYIYCFFCHFGCFLIVAHVMLSVEILILLRVRFLFSSFPVPPHCGLMYINHVQLPDKLNIKGNQYLIEAWLPHLCKDIHALHTHLHKVKSSVFWRDTQSVIHYG